MKNPLGGQEPNLLIGIRVLIQNLMKKCSWWPGAEISSFE
jgi:hypothetical protein